MFRRRKHGSRRGEQGASEGDHDGRAEPPGFQQDEPEREEPQGKTPRPSGPFDASEVDLTEARRTRIDLGGLLVPGIQGMQVQLQLDKPSGRAIRALLRLDNAAVQLIAVAAPRSSGMWDQTRLQVIEDAKNRGGTAEEASGPFGPEVRAVVPVTTSEGKKGRQPSRVSGIDGPRWMLRATFLGSATSDPAELQRMADLVRGVVVVRGEQPLPPGDVISLTVPNDGRVTSQSPES